MVKIYADGTPIYAPDLEGYELLGLTTTLSVEKAGTAEIVLPPDHPAYDSFVEYKTVIEIFRGDEMLFRGRALYPTDDMYRCRTITCEGERCFFRDSLLRPYLYQDTPANIFKDLVAQHNAQVDAFKRFRVGEITVVDDNDYVRLEGGSAETVAAVLDKLVGRCGGYIVFTTAEDGVRVINWYASIGRACSQMIEFGENLLDYSSTGANTNLATAVLPYGAKNETSGLRTTIETVNDGLDYIQDDEAVARHGFIIQPVVWDDVTKPGNLLTKARQYLDTSKHIVTSLELTAVDLSIMDKDIETFRVGDWVPVYSEPHGVHSAFQLRERTYDLLNPANDRVVLGKDLTTLTSQTTALEDEVVLKAVELSTRIGQNKYNELDNLVKANSTAITQTAEKLESKAEQSDYDALGEQVSKNTSSIEQMAGKIESVVTYEDVNGLVESKVTQEAGKITASVDDKISEVEAKITVEANKVRSEVADDISDVNSKIEQTATSIRGEVSDEVNDLYAAIDTSAGAIRAEVSNMQIGGTNLAAICRVGFANSAGTLTGEMIDRDKTHYCRSGKVMRLNPFEGSYNLGAHLGIQLQSGKQYMISFWAAASVENTGIWVNLFNSGRGVDVNLGEEVRVGSGGGYFTRLFECTVTDTYELRFINSGGHTGTIDIMDAQLEEGNKATAWSPCPDDTDEAIDKQSAALAIERDRITAEVTRASEAEGVLSGRIDVHEDAINLAVSRTVGGRNYIVNSKGPYVATGTGERHWLWPWLCTSVEEAASLYGKTVTVSFDYETAITSGSFGVLINTTWQGVEQFDSNGRTGHVSKVIDVNAATTTARSFLYIDGTWTGSVTFTNVKVEIGNTATDWSPHPEEFRAGSSVEITENRVKIASPETLIAIPSVDGETTVAQFDENGLTAARVISGNLAYHYDGPSVLYADANATDEQMKTGGYYRSLADACAAVSGKTIDREIAINILSGTYGEARLTGICGTGSISVNGNQNGLTGKLYIGRNTVDISLWGLTITGTGSAAVEQTGPGWVQWSECTFIGNSAASSYGLMMARRASAFLYNCGFYNAEHLLGVGTSADVVCNTLKGGGGTNFLYGDGGNVKWYGTRPDGILRTDHPALYAPSDLAALTIDYGTAQPSAPVIQTAEYSYLYSDNYRGGWSYFDDEDIRQGYNGANIYGVIWFDAAAIRTALSGKTINQASLRLHMQKGVGRGVAVSVQMYGTNTAYSERSGAPALTTSYGTIGTTEPDMVNEITIPNQVITDIVSGAIQGLVLKSDDAELYKDRSYSRNYARFSGTTSADSSTCPRLTVVYQ